MRSAKPAYAPQALAFEIACALDQVRPAGRRLRAFLVRSGCSEGEVMDCELALVEACNNAVKYARPEAQEAPVLVQVICEVRHIDLRVTDHTAGLEWPGEAALPQAEAERGRGIYLIKTLMDGSEYLRFGDRNVLVLRKLRRGCKIDDRE